MRHVIVFLAAFLVVVALSGGIAHAADQQTEEDPCPSWETPDECMGWSAPVSNGQYAACTAIGPVGQTCQLQVTDPFTHQLKCGYGSFSAYCYCDPLTLKVGGSCTYMR